MLASSTLRKMAPSNTSPNIRPSRNSPAPPNMRRTVTEPNGANSSTMKSESMRAGWMRRAITRRRSRSSRGGRLGRRLRLGPVLRARLRLLQRVHRLEARRNRSVGAGENLVMLDVERPQPALLTHGNGDEVADLHQLRLREMRMQTLPQGIVGRQVPGDGFGIGERRLLPVVIAHRGFEVDEVAVVVLDEAGLGG